MHFNPGNITKSLLLRENRFPILLAGAFFAGFLVLGLLTFRDYGTYIDEPNQIQIGHRTVAFLRTGDAKELDFPDWEHGPAFEALTVYTGIILPRNYPYYDVYYIRHLDVFLSFWVGCLAFFWLVRKKFKSWKMGLLGSAFLVASPVIFGNAFYNSKDIPFLAVYIISLCTLTLFLERPGWLTAAAHAFICGYLVNIRIPGIVIPALTLGLVALELVLPKRYRHYPNLKRLLPAVIIFTVLCIGFIILFFPASWSNPFQRFIDAYIAMTHRSWTCCFNLFMGQHITSEIIPWYYIPVWMGISTPIFYVGLFLVGLVVTLAGFLRRPWLDLALEKREGLVYLGTLFVPLIVIIAGRATVYNGWRHMYFIYVPFLVIALDGLVFLYRWIGARLSVRLAGGLVGLAVLISLVTTVVPMIQSHPYENIYFNFLAGNDMAQIKQNYELDYWGLPYVAALRYVLAHDPRPSIVISSNQGHILDYSVMLPAQDLARFKYVDDPGNSNYYITNYYMHPENYNYPNEIYSIKIGDASILSIFKMNP